jgi:hypothetical protein
VPRRISGQKGDEVTGGQRKLHNGELRNLYSSPSIIRMIKSRRMRWSEHVARMGREAGRKETTRKTKMDNIKMDLREIGWGGMDRMIWPRIGTSGGLL